MDLQVFIKNLEQSLVQCGIPREVAVKHVTTLQRTLTEGDLAEIDQIQSSTEVEELAKSIAIVLNRSKKNSGRPSTPREMPAETAPRTNPPVVPKPKEASFDDQEDAFSRLNDENNESYFAPYEQEGTKKGRNIFWGVLIGTLPITLALAAAFFGLFGGAFVMLTALIICLIALVAALVAGGAALSLVGIIFGVTQLFTFPAAGLFEIGLGVIIIGTVMLVGILLYNVALRFLPWVIRKVGVLLKFTCGKLRDLFLHLRRECYKL